MTSPPSTPATPTRLRPFKPRPFGRYTLLSPLAVGGMGEIYLARLEGAQGFQKLCVIKKILPHLASDAEFLQRFVNEARVLVKLGHGAIAQVLDMGVHDNEPYLALEHVDGKDLRRVIARVRDVSGRLPLQFCLYVMGRVLDALAYAHRKRDDEDREIELVHRDVSPQNILISYEGEVKVIDFGLAKSRLSVAKTNPSVILGKFLYMAPEQARHSNVDRRSDLYAVGLCLYELLAGKNPFDDVPTGELMARVAMPQIAPIDTVVEGLPPKLVAIVQRAIAIDPEQRFQTAAEMRGRLMSVLYELDHDVGPESIARHMRELFVADHAAERRLFASLQSSPVDFSEEAPRSTPPPGKPVTRVQGPIQPTPLSFAPTPRTGLFGQVLDGPAGAGVQVRTSQNPNVFVVPEGILSDDEHRSDSALRREGPTRAEVIPEAAPSQTQPQLQPGLASVSDSVLLREGPTLASASMEPIPLPGPTPEEQAPAERLESEWQREFGEGPTRIRKAPPEPNAEPVSEAADADVGLREGPTRVTPTSFDEAPRGSGDPTGNETDPREGPTRIRPIPRRTPPPLQAQGSGSWAAQSEVPGTLEGPTVITSTPVRRGRDVGLEQATPAPLGEAAGAAGLTHDTQPSLQVPEELRLAQAALAADTQPRAQYPRNPDTEPRAELPPGFFGEDAADSGVAHEPTVPLIRVPDDLRAELGASQPPATDRHPAIVQRSQTGWKLGIALFASLIVIAIAVALPRGTSSAQALAGSPGLPSEVVSPRDPPRVPEMRAESPEESVPSVVHVEDAGEDRSAALAATADAGAIEGGAIDGGPAEIDAESESALTAALADGGLPQESAGAADGGGVAEQAEMLAPLLMSAKKEQPAPRVRQVRKTPAVRAVAETELQRAFQDVSEEYNAFMRPRSCNELRYKILCSRYRRLRESVARAGRAESAKVMRSVKEFEEKLDAARQAER